MVPAGQAKSEEKPLTRQATYMLPQGDRFCSNFQKTHGNTRHCCPSGGEGAQGLSGRVLSCIAGDTQTVLAAGPETCPAEAGMQPSLPPMCLRLLGLSGTCGGRSALGAYANRKIRVAAKTLGRVSR